MNVYTYRYCSTLRSTAAVSTTFGVLKKIQIQISSLDRKRDVSGFYRQKRLFKMAEARARLVEELAQRRRENGTPHKSGRLVSTVDEK